MRIDRPLCHCGKRCYPSCKQARLACRKMGNRLRIYYCGAGRAYHVTNGEKR